MLKSERVRVADVLRANQTLQKLFLEFELDFEQVQSDLVLELIDADDVIQNYTVYVLAENPNSVANIATLNQTISTVLGLFPGVIESLHEDHYRDYISTARTTYTYLLKWIYYTYKYFNEEQFFFNNLLNRFVPDYDGQVVSSTSYLKTYFDGLGILLDTLDQKIEDLYTLGDIDTVDEKYLQHIAQLLGYQKEDFSIQNISFRELIKNLIDIYQTKGTEYSFELFFKLLGFDVEVREYYWDRDAQNPEIFGSVGTTDYLYYLTIQDPRIRIKEQLSNPSQAQSIQPINTKDWVMPKDLRDFTDLQTQYSVDQILGFKDSNLAKENRFTYFKTNFIQFKLTQFYTKQDLTAKDTETILKYVKFLTPIYISSFIEVATTPYQDFFEMSNPEARSIVLGGDPGIPPWVDILLPFIFITIKDYIPLNLAPAPEQAVIILQQGWSDLDVNGVSDTALSTIFGNPTIGISLTGVVLLTTEDLSVNKFISIKMDKGRGVKISIPGNTIQTYSQLVTALNNKFIDNSLGASTVIVGSSPNLDIRVYSNTLGTTSKMFIAPGLTDDLFTALSATLLASVDGIQFQRGYQDLGLSFANGSNFTGLNPASTYNLYVNLDINDFIEVDTSGPIPNLSTAQNIVNAINNHYTEKVVSSFVTSTTTQYVAADATTSGKILVGYRDTNTNNGRLVYMNSSGTVYRSGINFTLYDCRNITIASSKDDNVNRNLVAFYDTTNDFAKWTVFDNEGIKIITAQELESAASLVGEIVAVTLANNKIAVAYTVNSPTLAVKVKTFDLTGPTLVDSLTLPSGAMSDIVIEHLGNGLVVGGSTATGGLITYLDEDLTYTLSTYGASTKTFTIQQPIADISFTETVNQDVFIIWRDLQLLDKTGYFCILDDIGSSVKVVTQYTSDDLDLASTSKTSNGSIVIAYSKDLNGYAYFQVFSADGNVLKKEKLLYNNTSFSELVLTLDASGSFTVSIAIPNKGFFSVWEYLGEITSLDTNNRLVIQSLMAGDTWDDSVDNYADTSDQGHLFVMNSESYEFDNYAEYYRSLGINFTSERNKFNTFYISSPNDDLIPLIEDVLTFAFTLLIGTNEFPADNVDKTGFYIKRNGYISRDCYSIVNGNTEKGYYTRHQDFSESIRIDPYKVRREIDWPQWNKNNTLDDDWSSWTLAIDYFQPSINWPAYSSSGGAILGGTYVGGQYFEFEAPMPIGGAIFFGNGQPYGPFFEFIAPMPFGSIISNGSAIYSTYYIYIAPEPVGTMIFSGAAITTKAFNYIFTGSGKATLSGSVKADQLGYVKVATGGAVLGGAAFTAVGNVYLASGSAILSGTAITSYVPIYLFNGSGFMTLSGTAPKTIERTYTSSGGAILSGAAPFAIGVIGTVGGGTVTLSGSAIYYPEQVIIMSGGILMGGTALYTIEFVRTTSGGMMFTGAAPHTIQFARTGTGGAILSGSGGYQEGGL